MRKIATIILFVLVVNNVLPQELASENQISSSSTFSKVYKSDANERIFTGGIILLEAAILVMILFYWKKTRNDTKNNVDSNYKRNISAIRDERVKPIFNKSISKKRKTINKLVKIKNLNSQNITSRARAINIAKGELILAAKIYSLTQQVR